MVLVLVELGVADPVPAFNAPLLPDKSQQGFWGGAQVGEEQMPGLERLAATTAAGDQLNDPSRPWPVRLDVLRCFLCPQCPGDVTAVADLVMRCSKGDVALPLELTADLPLQGLLVGFNAQDEVGPLLRELSKSLVRVERIRLDQHNAQIQLAKELLELGVFVALSGRVASMSDLQA